MIATTFYLLFQLALLVWVWAKWAPRITQSVRIQRVALVVWLMGVSIPINGLPVLFYFRGFFGEISLATLVYSVLFLAKCTRKLPEAYSVSMAQGLVVILLLGLLLYPASLGLGPFDMYALGFGARAMVIIFVAACLLSVVFRNWLMLGVLWFGVVLYLFQALPSDNLWDYWIDPIIWIVSIGFTVRWVKHMFSSSRIFSDQSERVFHDV